MPTPFEYRPYQPQSLAALAQLVGAPQRAEAQALREAASIRSRQMEVQGQGRAALATSIGSSLQSLAQLPMQIRQQRGEEAERALRMRGLNAQTTMAERGVQSQDVALAQAKALQELFGTNPNPKPEDVYRIVGPQAGAEILKGQAALKEQSQKMFTSTTQLVGTALGGVLALPEPLQAPEYAEVRQTLIGRGLIQPSDLPEAFDPGVLKQSVLSAMSPEKQFDAMNPKPVNLGAGDTLVNPNTGATVASGGPRPSSFQSKDMLVDGKAATVNFDPASGNYFAPGSTEPLKNVKPIPPQGPQPQYEWATDPKDGKVKLMSIQEIRATGGAQPATAAERMDARKFEKSAPVLKAIGELSEKINTQNGVIAKISGEAERQKAKINLNDDVAEYEALVSGFTPLIARSLGHTGVLTQQDVDSVKALFPRPGDSKSLRDRKVSRLMGIVKQLEGAEATAAPSAATGPTDGQAGTVNGTPATWKTNGPQGPGWYAK